jgi:2-polyprenyl-6-methoxyphenol hydroxylase-like FAD-dependent oxidoreductase
MKILIVGGGIGGLALAGYLKNTAIDFDIIEKHQDWNHEGFSLGMWSNARSMLKKLDLADKFDTQGRPFQFLRICDGQGTLLKEYNLAKFHSETGITFSHVRRTEIHEWLLERVDESCIRKGTTITAIDKIPSSNALNVTLSDSTTVLYDLVVGADGIHSTVRDLLFAHHVEGYSDWRVWWLWADRNTASPHAATEYLEPGMFAMVFDERDKALVVLAARCDHALWDDAPQRIKRLKTILKDHHISISIPVDLKPEDILPTDLTTVRLKRWTLPNAVLIGDAAHALEPFAGMGASMALEDAYVLAENLKKFSDNIPKALKQYERVRRIRVKKVQRLTERMRGWMAIESPIMRKIVNHLIPFIPERLFVDSYMNLLKEKL